MIKNYEYKRIILHNGKGEVDVIELNEAASEGWRPIFVFPDYSVLLERQVDQERSHDQYGSYPKVKWGGI